MLDEKSDYPLLHSLVYGKSVSVNINALTKALKKHRNTLRRRVEELFENRVLVRPFFPFVRLFREYPLLVLTETNLPYDNEVLKWFREDPHIFAALRSRHSSYNTLLILYHKDITSYELWREKLDVEGKFRSVAANLGHSSTSFHSNQLMIKYEPNAPVHVMEEDLKTKGEVLCNGYKLDKLSFQILRLLAEGKCIKLNESQLSKELGLNRSTIVRKTQEFIDEGWISNPVCRFPGFFTPPKYVLAMCKLELKSDRQAFIQTIRKDPHVTMALNTSQDEYNILLFAAFRNLDEELTWEVENDVRFPKSIGNVSIRFFSLTSIPDMLERRIYLGVIDENFMYFRT
jgi:DNA-binding Lrp family transcriptional regulator